MTALSHFRKIEQLLIQLPFMSHDVLRLISNCIMNQQNLREIRTEVLLPTWYEFTEHSDLDESLPNEYKSTEEYQMSLWIKYNRKEMTSHPASTFDSLARCLLSSPELNLVAFNLLNSPQALVSVT